MPVSQSGRPPLLRLRGLYSPRLSPVSLDLATGECAAVMGPSGAGKSLLLRQVADLDPGSGEVGIERPGALGHEGFRVAPPGDVLPGRGRLVGRPGGAAFAPDRAKAAAVMARLGAGRGQAGRAGQRAVHRRAPAPRAGAGAGAGAARAAAGRTPGRAGLRSRDRAGRGGRCGAYLDTGAAIPMVTPSEGAGAAPWPAARGAWSRAGWSRYGRDQAAVPWTRVVASRCWWR